MYTLLFLSILLLPVSILLAESTERNLAGIFKTKKEVQCFQSFLTFHGVFDLI
jgi:hypothetical protein